ncbi:MAG: undecaprenyldiphospho-muramoylpentapeptide beta-N-acetylglucosaminyltransferase [Candidatus Doudnabacteria bacterium]|nr:undecaprenyldiphospho-muramoylpentapeptide beta-N-acetylglucosaminyltransferase [Candidatus Doudnabacteria bacterium]
MTKPLKIILAGGGTGGPTSPLLAVASALTQMRPDAQFLFIGTLAGPERQLVEEAGIKFVPISAGKLRRYFSFSNAADFFRTLKGYFQAKKILREFQPDLVFSVGSFVAVPVIYAARKLKIKILIHQQDARIGLANKLTAPFAHCITTAFEKTAKEFYAGTGFEKNPKVRTEWVGNPVRREFLNNDTTGREFFQLHGDLPILLIFGGATGAEQINTVTYEALPELLKAHQIIHITGRGKRIDYRDPNYHQYEFLSKEMPVAMKVADIVVSRAGLSTIAELSALGKIAVLVPMPDSHQEENAQILKDANAAVVLSKDEFTAETFARVIVSLKFNQKRLELLQNNIRNIMPHDSAERIAKIIIEKFDVK